MVALVRSMTGDHPARPAIVISNVPDAPGLDRARALEVSAEVVDHRQFGNDRAGFEMEMDRALDAAGVDLLCHAGFMRIVTPGFADRWAGRSLNIHPSLLPRHRGLHTHRRVIEAGEGEHGCSVHEVTAELDAGPVLGQGRLAVRPGDTEQTLAERVQRLEHRLYPAVLRRFAAGDRTPVMIEERSADVRTHS